MKEQFFDDISNTFRKRTERTINDQSEYIRMSVSDIIKVYNRTSSIQYKSYLWTAKRCLRNRLGRGSYYKKLVQYINKDIPNIEERTEKGINKARENIIKYINDIISNSKENMLTGTSFNKDFYDFIKEENTNLKKRLGKKRYYKEIKKSIDDFLIFNEI